MRPSSLFLLSALATATLSYNPTSAQNAKATIVAANQKFMDIFSRGAEQMGRLFTRDAIMYSANREPVRGTAALDGYW